MTRRHLSILCLAGALLAAGPITAADTPDGAISNGITVHGHWRIEILEPDGTLVSVTEFENALTLGGKAMLAVALTRVETVGSWRVDLISSGSGACDSGSGVPMFCRLTEPGSYLGGVLHSSNLLVTTPGTGGIQLSGTVTADYASTINSVDTALKTCSPATTPADCPAYDVGSITTRPFTSATLASPPSVQAGQIIQVTITISFS